MISGFCELLRRFDLVSCFEEMAAEDRRSLFVSVGGMGYFYVCVVKFVEGKWPPIGTILVVLVVFVMMLCWCQNVACAISGYLHVLCYLYSFLFFPCC